MKFDSSLPIDTVLDEICLNLVENTRLVLVAPPGAGKTTRLPLVLMNEAWASGLKILVLEPRRLAARAAASRMASTLGEGLGETIGLRVRFESKISAKTRIEVVTEGVFTRLLVDNPSLDGYAAVIFDEFHERSLDADFGLALALEAQEGLRDDLKLIVMSATLDGARVQALLKDAPLVISEGRAFPVETHFLGRLPNVTIEEQVALACLKGVKEETGSMLVFLPGMGEIKRVETKLRERISDKSIEIVPLFGALDISEQRKAIEKPLPNKRKIVLATSIAETSITIEGVRVVVDCGLSRVPKFEPDLGITRLETVRSSKATSEQRRGRAGRVEAGVCYRLWGEHEEGAFPSFATPEILSADLSSLILDCAAWGSEINALKWLDMPPLPAVNEAKTLLHDLKALENRRLTKKGEALRLMPLSPRLANLVYEGERKGMGLMCAMLATLLSEKGLGGDDVSLVIRFENFLRDKSDRAMKAKQQAATFVKIKGETDLSRLGEAVALAFPDRIAKARGKTGEFVLANGRGAFLENFHALAREPYLAVGELTGKAQNTRILAAAAFYENDFDKSLLETKREVYFDKQAKALRAREGVFYLRFALKEAPAAIPPSIETAKILAENIYEHLPFSKGQAMLLKRFVNFSEQDVASTKDVWLAPSLISLTKLSEVSVEVLQQALDTLIDYSTRQAIEKLYPSHFLAPTGNSHLINYDGEEPTLSIRLQELYGVREHPSIGKNKIPLLIELLSPAHKPVQITRDLVGFWHGSYKDVKNELKGRYPRHLWADDPMNAVATARAKPKGT